MQRFWAGVGAGVLGLLLLAAVHRETNTVVFENGLEASAIRPLASGVSTDTTMEMGGTDAASVKLLAGAGIGTLDANGFRVALPGVQTLAAGGTVAADACGGVKRIDAAGAVTTSTTNTIAAPATGNSACFMILCNVGATNTITLDKNANIVLVGGADVALLANSCIGVYSSGSIWRQTSAQLTAS